MCRVIKLFPSQLHCRPVVERSLALGHLIHQHVIHAIQQMLERISNEQMLGGFASFRLELWPRVLHRQQLLGESRLVLQHRRRRSNCRIRLRASGLLSSELRLSPSWL